MRAIVAALVALAAPVALAQEARLIAVLPLSTSNASLSPAAIEKLEESVRTVANDVLAPQGFTVLTGDNTIKVLRDNGVDSERACEASCAVDLGKELKARYVIAGAVASDEGVHSAFIRLYDVETGGMLASLKLKGRSGNELEDQFDQRGKELFEKARILRTSSSNAVAPPRPASGPLIQRGAVAPVVADVTIDVKPRKSAELLVTAPDGQATRVPAPYKNEAAQPGRWSVEASAPGYERQTLTLELAPDAIELRTLELVQLGALSIDGTPVGAAVTVTGPGGFQDKGGLPWKAQGLPTGKYRAEVTRAGYEAATQEAQVAPGGDVALTFRLEQKARAEVPPEALTDGADPKVAPPGGRSTIAGVLAVAATLVAIGAGAYSASVVAGDSKIEGGAHTTSYPDAALANTAALAAQGGGAAALVCWTWFALSGD